MNSTQGGPGAIQGCVTDGYSAVRRNPALRNVSIDKIDSCSEVTSGLLATGLVTLLIWVVTMPFFDLGGMMWIRSWEGHEPITLEAFKANMGILRPATIMDQDWAPLSISQKQATLIGAFNAEGVDKGTFVADAFENFQTPMNSSQAEYAFERLDTDHDLRVTSEELNSCLAMSVWDECHAPTTTVTTTTMMTTMSEEFVAQTTVTVAAPTTYQPPQPAGEESPQPTQQPVEEENEGPGGVLPSSIKGPFVTVSLKVPELGGERLTDSARKNMANVFREDLAYAAGILATEVMDVRARTGCVFGKASTNGDLTYYSKGCLALPAGATKADIEAVLVSHSMRGKIADDLTGVHMLEDRAVSSGEIQLDVTETETCAQEQVPAGTIYCEDGSYQIGGDVSAPEPVQEPSTTEAATTTAGPTAPPGKEITFSEFIHALGSEASGTEFDALAAIETTGDSSITQEEFIKAATTKCSPSFSVEQAQALFNKIDTDKSYEVSQQEFNTAWTAMSSEATAPITLQDYKTQKSKAVHFLNLTLAISNNDQIHVTEDSAYGVVDSIVIDIAFMAGLPTVSCIDLDKKEASMSLYLNGQKVTKHEGDQPAPTFQNAAPLEAYALIKVEDKKVDDLVALLNTKVTKQRIADHLSELQNFGQITADDITMHFNDVPAGFDYLDVDKSGGLNLDEFKKAAGGFVPPLHSDQVDFAYKGLNQDANGELNKNEYDAASITEFSA